MLLICLRSFATEDTHLGVAFRNLPRHPLEPLYPCASAVYGNCDIKMKYLGRGGKSDKTSTQVFSNFFLFSSFSPFPKRAFAALGESLHSLHCQIIRLSFSKVLLSSILSRETREFVVYI